MTINTVWATSERGHIFAINGTAYECVLCYKTVSREEYMGERRTPCVSSPTNWTRGSGSMYRMQRNYFAHLVTVRMTGREEADVCPTCGGPLCINTREVDRAVPDLDYIPGNIMYICKPCNAGRGVLQSNGEDIPNVERYTEDVQNVSREVLINGGIPSVTDSKAWWDSSKAFRTRGRSPFYMYR